MRLTTWNVGMALRKKQPALAKLRPDISILQEVSKTDASAHAEYCWVGNNPTKGLAVVASNGFQVRVHPAYEPRIEFIVPIEVSGPVEFLLLAVWVMHNRAVTRIQERPNRWQMLQALEAYEPLLRSQRCVVAGDFNNAVRWDGPRKSSNHSSAVEKLSDLGLVSAYHTRSVASQGEEPDPTLFWMRHRDSPYHIDYIWLPKAWVPGLKAVEVGDFSTWVQSGLSDHVPLTIELDDAVIGHVEPGNEVTTAEEVSAPI
jgi:exodeoxyribonuclease-3